LVVDCPPDIFASLRQRFVEVVEESHARYHPANLLRSFTI
jgi:hypothetical protein